MPVPLHGEKYDSEPVRSAGREAAYARERGPETADGPRSVVVCFEDTPLENLVETYAGRELPSAFDDGGLYRLEDTDGRVGVVGGFGIGAPATAMVVESLAGRGVESFVLRGYAGVLDADVDSTDTLVATEALRDEGASYHYRPAARTATPPGDLTDDLVERLDHAGETVRTGPTWTTDAPFRETRAEVERYAAEGVLTVEMEAAAAFVVAADCEAEATAAFVPSDYLGSDSRAPGFHDIEESLLALADRLVAALAARE
ncbi:MAG: phosphorylase [Haloarculaceae archaeon]